MLDIDAMKHQHAEIGQAMSETMAAIDGGRAASEAPAVAALLGDISSQIHKHLATEDAEVYPVLADSDDPTIERTAKRFQANMGGLADEFDSYFGRYDSAEAIGRDPSLFGYETRTIFERLRHRMRREESDLYPRLDEV